MRDPVAAADLVEQHLAAATEPVGELLAIVAEHFLRRPIALKRLRERQTDRAAGRALDHPREHAEARMIIDAGHDPRLAQLTRDDVDQHRGEHDVQLPQLHRRRPLPAQILRALAPTRLPDDEAVTDENAMRSRATATAPAPPGHASTRARSAAPHFGCARRSSDTHASSSGDA
jgi:hypothetical protein